MMLFEVVTVLLIITAALFIHEMGHAVAVILQNKKAKAEIFFGSSGKEKKLKLTFGRITCYLTVTLSGFCQTSNPEELPPTSSKQKVVFFAAGPIASFLGFAALFIALRFYSGVAANIIDTLAFANFLIFVTSLIPMHYPSFLGGLPTDGLQILTQIKENKTQRKSVSQEENVL